MRVSLELGVPYWAPCTAGPGLWGSTRGAPLTLLSETPICAITDFGLQVRRILAEGVIF